MSQLFFRHSLAIVCDTDLNLLGCFVVGTPHGDGAILSKLAGIIEQTFQSLLNLLFVGLDHKGVTQVGLDKYL